jgi:hypothetical protein
MLNQLHTQIRSSQARRAIAYFLAFTLCVVIVTVERAMMPRFAPSTSLIIFATMAVITIASGILIGNKHATSKIVAVSTTFLLTNIAMLFVGFAVYLLPLAIVVSFAGALPALHQKPRNTRAAIILSISVVVIVAAFAGILDYAGFIAQRIMLNSFYR